MRSGVNFQLKETNMNNNEQAMAHMRRRSGGAVILPRIGCLYPIPVFVDELPNSRTGPLLEEGILSIPMRQYRLRVVFDKDGAYVRTVATPLPRYADNTTTEFLFDDVVLGFTLDMDAYNSEDDMLGTVAARMAAPDFAACEMDCYDWYHVVHLSDKGVVICMSGIVVNDEIAAATCSGVAGAGLAALKRLGEERKAVGYVKVWTLQVPRQNIGDSAECAFENHMDALSDAMYSDYLKKRFATYTPLLLPDHAYEHTHRRAAGLPAPKMSVMSTVDTKL